MNPKFEMRMEALRQALVGRSVNIPADAHAVVAAAKIYEEFLAGDFVDLQRALENKIPVDARHPDLPPPKAAEQPMPLEQPEAPAGKTVEDCRHAFARYIARGDGRSAAKFVNDTMMKKYGCKSIHLVSPERLGELYADFEAA